MKILLAIYFASLVQCAPKQIVIAPPPPPSPPSGVGPGMIFGFLVPGFTNSTFGATQLTQLCSTLTNATTGYASSAIKCYLGPEGVSPYPGDGVLVTGFLQWQNFPGMTAQDKANAVISRDAFEYYLRNSALSSLNTTFPGIEIDCSCNPYYKGNADTFILNTPVPGVPLAKCGTVSLDKLRDADTGLFLGTAGSVGLDNGRTCAAGPQYIVPATPQYSGDISGPGSRLVCIPNAFDPTGKLFECYFIIASAASLQNMQPGQVITLTLGTTADAQIAALPCTSDQRTNIRKVLGSGAFTLLDASGDGYKFIDIDVQRLLKFDAPLTCTTSDGEIIPGFNIYLEENGGPVQAGISGTWSPLCDTNFAFYKANNPVDTTADNKVPSIGAICPACLSPSGSTTLFSYNGPNKGKFCSDKKKNSEASLTGGAYETSLNYRLASKAGTACNNIDVYSGPNTFDSGKPVVAGFETILNPYPVSAIFPGLDSYFGPSEYSTASSVAIDTQADVPCSTPRLSKAPTQFSVAGSIDQGTCNTVSLFNNGGTGPKPNGNGIEEDVDSCAILSTEVNGPLAPAPPPPGGVPSPAVVSPSPAPVVPPSPEPIPSPSPSPSIPSPTPSPSPKRCVYTGQYRIIPTKSTCGSKSLAFYESCSNTTVVLRTPDQVSSTPSRGHWTLTSTTEGAVATGGTIAAEKSCDNKYLAAPKGKAPKLGGNAWKWQVFFKGNDCNRVVIKSVNSGTFLGVNSRCTNVISTNTAETFKLKKVA